MLSVLWFSEESDLVDVLSFTGHTKSKTWYECTRNTNCIWTTRLSLTEKKNNRTHIYTFTPNWFKNRKQYQPGNLTVTELCYAWLPIRLYSKTQNPHGEANHALLPDGKRFQLIMASRGFILKPGTNTENCLIQADWLFYGDHAIRLICSKT